MKKTVFIALTSLLFVVSACSEKETDFSGRWILNKLKSEDAIKETGISMTLDIKHKGDSLIIFSTISIPDGTPLKRQTAYSLNGEETVTEDDYMKQTVKAEWSPDKQTFSITTVYTSKRKVPYETSSRVETYSLTDSKNILIISYIDTHPESWQTTPVERNHSLVFDKSVAEQ